jgi:hypothetical protein
VETRHWPGVNPSLLDTASATIGSATIPPASAMTNSFDDESLRQR